MPDRDPTMLAVDKVVPHVKWIRFPRVFEFGRRDVVPSVWIKIVLVPIELKFGPQWIYCSLRPKILAIV